MGKHCVWPKFSRPKMLCGKSFFSRFLKGYLLTSIASATFITSKVNADIGVEPPPIYNLYGQIGLLDMPSARLTADGGISFTFAADKTDEHYNLGFEFLPWLETTFRYSRIDRYNVGFSTTGPTGADGDLYDRSLSVKVRLAKEDNIWPSIVAGAQDIFGTGAYGGEYIAASKKFGSLDFTLGLGWRRLAGLETFSNPIGLIFPSFKTLTGSNSTGLPLTNEFFHGPDVGLFGGVTWQTPVDGLALILELSGDSYRREQGVGSINIRSRVNAGLSYEPVPGLQIGGGYLYGSEFGMRITLHMNAFDPRPEPTLGPQPLEPVIRSPNERADSSINLLETITHFYDDAPIFNAQKSRDIDVDDFVDQIFDSASQKNSPVRDAEVFGGSMLLEISGHSKNWSCAKLNAMAPETITSNMHQIVVSFTGSSSVEICPVEQSRRQDRAAHQYASLGKLSLIENDPKVILDDTDRHLAEKKEFNPEDLKQKLKKDLLDQRLAIVAMIIKPTRIEIAFSNSVYRSIDEAMGRLLRVLMADAPSSIEEFRIVNMAYNTPTIAVTLSRADIERTLNMFGSGTELRPASILTAVPENDPLFLGNFGDDFPKFSYAVSPGLHKSFFDPDNPLRIGVFVGLNGGVDIDRHLSLGGSFEVNVYNTFNITRPPDSLLPHVRTDFAEYYRHGINGISSLQTSYFVKLSPDIYAMARAGYLEDMFGGLGGEILWEPLNARWALGAALYEVQQRNFDRLFGFQEYRVLTGHTSLYYQSPFYGLNFQLHVGRYLAGDYGATFQMTRRFDNGIEIGAYATLTNVPFSVFGEGSFDKGFIIHIPLENLAPINTQDLFTLDFSPLTRDGGQRLEGEQTLYRYVQSASEGDLRANWDEVLRP